MVRPSRRRRIHPAQALALLQSGLKPREVAHELGCTRTHVYVLLREAREQELFKPPRPEHVLPWIPPGVDFKPGVVCTHPPIPPGDPRVCLCCSASGWDWMASFRNPGVPPDPKPKYAPKPELAGGVVEAAKPKPKPPTTRKEKRRLRFAALEAARARATVDRLKAAG